MKILLFGKNGQVGWELNRSLQPLGEVIAHGREDADFSAPDCLRKIVRDVMPDVIVNAVAYTAVDKAEEEKNLALTINAESPKVLAEEALRINALLVHYSTEYVFDGTKSSPYTEDDEPSPVNVYGRSKHAGEMAIQASDCDYFIIRTSWVYASRGHNFLLTILRLAKERDELCIVDDQIGSPTSARSIADVTFHCVNQLMKDRADNTFSSTLVHVAAAGSVSWYGFAKEIVNSVVNKLHMKIQAKNIKAIPSSDYPTPARRPLNSQLAIDKLYQEFHIAMPGWKNEIEVCVEELKRVHNVT